MLNKTEREKVKKELEKYPNMMLQGTYKFIDFQNSFIYIGKTFGIKASRCILDRILEHFTNKNASKGSLDYELAKLNTAEEFFTRFSVSEYITGENPTPRDVRNWEAKGIAEHNSLFPNGYNLQDVDPREVIIEADYLKHLINKKMFLEITKKCNLSFMKGDKVLILGTIHPFIKEFIEFFTEIPIMIHNYNYSNAELNEIKKDLEKYMNRENKRLIVISNPPYNKIGCQIDEFIIKELKPDEFVNIQPMKDFIDYNSDLYQYIDLNSINVLNERFADAAVASYIMKFNSTPNRGITKTDIRVKAKVDPDLLNVWYEHYNRPEDGWCDWIDSGLNPYNYDSQTIIEGVNDLSNGHLPYGARKNDKMWSYLYNTNQINCTELVDNKRRKDKSYANSLRINFTGYHCKTQLIHDNIIKFIYSDEGFRFLSKMATSYNTSKPEAFFKNILPRVDWTKEWTVEEILKDYKSTDEEIKIIMEDLKNFKGMDD